MGRTAKFQSGSIYKLIGTNRLCLIESSITIDNSTLLVVYPLSHAVFMASDSDFIIMDDPSFTGPVMAESWNCLTLPKDWLDEYRGKLSSKYQQSFISFVYFKYQSSKNRKLDSFTGPPITNTTDIRYLFRAQETALLSGVRDRLLTTTSKVT